MSVTQHVARVLPQPALLTVEEAAAYLNVSRWMVYQLIWSNQLRTKRIGRCRRVPRVELDRYISGEDDR
jgi:excisionase family DNA binding protein